MEHGIHIFSVHHLMLWNRIFYIVISIILTLIWNFENRKGMYIPEYRLINLNIVIISIQKNGEYYRRATFSKDRFQEGRYYFYEIDNIPIGSMALEILDEEFDREFEKLNVFLIIFSSLGLVFTGWYCLKTRKRIFAVYSKNE